MKEHIDLDGLYELWGDIEDFYPTEEIDDERRQEWMSDMQEWVSAILAQDITLAERIELNWGDSPATRIIQQSIIKN